jgi:hypothetical protein
MDTKDLEKRVNKMGGISYWKEDVLVGKKCCRCGEDKEISEFSYSNKKKGIFKSECKSCNKERQKYWYENNREYDSERKKKYNRENKEKVRARWRKRDYKKYYNEHKERINERKRITSPKRYRKYKEQHLKEIENTMKEVNPILKELEFPIYGYIYVFTNIKTGHKYIGQTTLRLSERYGSNIIKSWIKERKEKQNQKFLDELNEEDFELTDVFDIAICKWHLDKLESWYIDKFNSCDNGYNNNYGNYNTTDGLDEFNEILKTYNLQYIDGKIIKAPTLE